MGGKAGMMKTFLVSRKSPLSGKERDGEELNYIQKTIKEPQIEQVII